MLNIPIYKPNLAPVSNRPSDTLSVSEIFYSVQGEGRFAGHPAVFVRLMYCNLGCAWCDTRYTWDSRKLDDAKNFGVSELSDLVCSLVPKESRSLVHVVITGGEPLLHTQSLS